MCFSTTKKHDGTINIRTRKMKVKVNFCIAYCYETIISQYAIVTDRAGVQPI